MYDVIDIFNFIKRDFSALTMLFVRETEQS